MCSYVESMVRRKASPYCRRIRPRQRMHDVGPLCVTRYCFTTPPSGASSRLSLEAQCVARHACRWHASRLSEVVPKPAKKLHPLEVLHVCHVEWQALDFLGAGNAHTDHGAAPLAWHLSCLTDLFSTESDCSRLYGIYVRSALLPATSIWSTGQGRSLGRLLRRHRGFDCAPVGDRWRSRGITSWAAVWHGGLVGRLCICSDV